MSGITTRLWPGAVLAALCHSDPHLRSHSCWYNGSSAPTAKPHQVVALVRRTCGRPDLRRTLALHQHAARLPAGRGQAAQLTVLHHGLADPIDAGVVADCLVVRVHHDHLEPLVRRVLRHPVGVQHAEAPALAAHPLLCDAAEVARGLVFVDALVAWLPI